MGYAGWALDLLFRVRDGFTASVKWLVYEHPEAAVLLFGLLVVWLVRLKVGNIYKDVLNKFQFLLLVFLLVLLVLFFLVLQSGVGVVSEPSTTSSTLPGFLNASSVVNTSF